MPPRKRNTPQAQSEAPRTATPPKADAEAFAESDVSWPEFLRSASDAEVSGRISQEIAKLLAISGLAERYACVALLDPKRSISGFDADLIYNALKSINGNRERDVLLFIVSGGGGIEPAYQISKLCKSFARERFVVAVAREAKSAATLISIGADEIHMGPLSQLGPIDPQLGGLPALGVVQALKSIASLAEQYPGSADLFARYLRMTLTVEQIGYCERISESAVQYAERLLGTKATLAGKAATVARDLVYEYKDHGFVIDMDEAKAHLGSDWIVTDSPELKVAEEIYSLFDMANLWLGMLRKRRIIIVGTAESGAMLFPDE